MTHTLYIDRNIGKKEGLLTLSNGNQHVFKQLPFATGQSGFLDGGADDWVTGKGGTPYGVHWMSTKKEPLQMEPVGTPFYVMSTKKGSRVIEGADGKSRSNIGLHLENRFPGSAGCVVLLHRTKEEKLLTVALFAYLDALYAYEPYIEAKVL